MRIRLHMKRSIPAVLEQDISVGGGNAVSLVIAAAAAKKLLMLSQF